MKILITGSCGTIGSALLDYLLTLDRYRQCEFICVDNSENGLFFQKSKYTSNNRIKFMLCDIRSSSAVNRIMQGVDCVFHSAALKHVGICETSPEQAVMTNILGTQNLIDSAIQHRVSKFLFMSSDKAVNPTNVMGTSKLMAERIVIAGNLRDSDTKFSCTRFGNVLGSSGSVLPIFLKQIDSGGPITLTDKRMTRFIMTIRDAVMLVVKSMEQLVGGEIFITKMPVVKIADLATALIELKTQINVIQVTEVGASPGEKLYEELMTEQEMPWSVELDNFFMVKPMLGGIYQNIPEFDLDRKYPTCDRVYNSRNEIALTVLELKRYITSNDLLNAD